MSLKPIKLTWRKQNRNLSRIRNIFTVLSLPMTLEISSVAHSAFKNLCRWWSKCVFQGNGNSNVRALLLQPDVYSTKEGKRSQVFMSLIPLFFCLIGQEGTDTSYNGFYSDKPYNVSSPSPSLTKWLLFHRGKLP